MRQLVRIADEAGLGSSKQELLAALVCAAAPEPEAIEDALRRYRTSTAGDIALTEPGDGGLILIHRRSPGRPAA
ncbi:MAG TPA: hypothetical protein VF228_19595 [Iamia sp.]